MMKVVRHDNMTACISYADCEQVRMIGGVYVHPQDVKEVWLEGELAWDGCQLLCGDFNARHPRWDMGCQQPNNIGRWRDEYSTGTGQDVWTPPGHTFRSVSAIDLVPGHDSSKISYSDKAGLEHLGVVIRIRMDDHVDLVRSRPDWRQVGASQYDEVLD